jgi:hypothetical protein
MVTWKAVLLESSEFLWRLFLGPMFSMAADMSSDLFLFPSAMMEFL